MEQIISGDKAKMPMTERFYSVNGQMMGYESGGVKKDFLTDHLGSITAEIDQTQTRTYDTRYSAYGRNNWSTGTGCGFGWVGSYGYRETGLFHMSHYVRARHYSYVTGGWSTVDPLWPGESAYGYTQGRTVSTIDPSGLQAGVKRCKCGGPLLGDEQIIFFEGWPGVKVDPDCPPWFKDRIKRACDKLNDIPNNKRGQINDCIAKASARAGLSGCMPVTLNRRQCLARFCQVDGKVHCNGLPAGVAVCAIDLWLVCRDWDTEGFTSFRDCAGAVLANLPPSVRLGCILGLATCLTCLERYVPKPGIVPPGAGVIGGVIYLTKEFKYGKCCGYDLACNSCDTVSNGGAIDCVDQACASHDSCLATWREYLDPRQQYDCARKLCQSINECLESGGCATSPDPKACIQAANEIRILYCTMGLM